VFLFLFFWPTAGQCCTYIHEEEARSPVTRLKKKKINKIQKNILWFTVNNTRNRKEWHPTLTHSFFFFFWKKFHFIFGIEERKKNNSNELAIWNSRTHPLNSSEEWTGCTHRVDLRLRVTWWQYRIPQKKKHNKYISK
jgi:hypothetical protein